MSVLCRQYRGPADDPRIRELLSQHYSATRHPYFSIDPPNWERLSAALRLDGEGPDIHLWFLDRPQTRLVGLLLIQKSRRTVSWLVHPCHSKVHGAIADWVERQLKAASTAQEDPGLLRCSVCEANEAQREALACRGYVRGEPTVIFRRRSLHGHLPVPDVDRSYRIQEVQALPEEGVAERAGVEREVFGGAIGVETLRELQRAPIYRPELDLVVMAPDGRIAAFCTAWFDDQQRVGYFEPIGTVRAHRRRGLGKVLLLDGFRRLQRMGATVVYLGHSADNSAASRLYESVGMAVFDREYWWQKRV